MAASRQRFSNWSRSDSCAPARIERPASEAEVQECVRRAGREGLCLRTVGAGHSWNDAMCTEGVLLSLDRLDKVHAIDREGLTVTVEAGIRLRVLNEALALAGVALPVLGSIAEQSIAGAIATGTHGSAPKLGNLSSLVLALRLVTASGEVRTLSREQEPELFSAARVSLGALGVVTQVTLRVVPAFGLEEIAEPMAFDDALARLPALLESEPYVKLWWLPHTDFIQVFRHRPTEAKSTHSKLLRWLDVHVMNALVFAALLALGRLVPALVPALNRLVRLAYFVPARRVARSDLALTIAMPPRHQETEVALPVERAAEAVRRARALIEREKLCIDFILELRFVAADDALLSPDFGRASCRLGAYQANPVSCGAFFTAFEQDLKELGARPHWGKSFRYGPDELAVLVPNLKRFEELRASLDPAGVFENAFVRRVLAGVKGK